MFVGSKPTWNSSILCFLTRDAAALLQPGWGAGFYLPGLETLFVYPIYLEAARNAVKPFSESIINHPQGIMYLWVVEAISSHDGDVFSKMLCT